MCWLLNQHSRITVTEDWANIRCPFDVSSWDNGALLFSTCVKSRSNTSGIFQCELKQWSALHLRVRGVPLARFIMIHARVMFADWSVVMMLLTCNAVWPMKPQCVCGSDSQNAQQSLDQCCGHLCVCVCSLCAACSVSHSVSAGPHDWEQVALWCTYRPPTHT